jgi:2-dehydro-3-deoxy-D-arabinonate dehydratase
MSADVPGSAPARVPTIVTATADGVVVARDGVHRRIPASIDDLFTSDDPGRALDGWFAAGSDAGAPPAGEVRAPIGTQEVWACGVTYLRSRDARMTEAEQAGGAVFYDRVYDADRPEIFVKAAAHRVAGPGQPVRIRADSTWNVPEPELTLAISASGAVFGFTIGNDMSSRSIEGDNPLYIPQAKVYDGCAALGPCLVVGELPGGRTAIRMRIARDGAVVFSGETALSQLKRSFAELVGYLLRDNSFPAGAYLMTGTGIVPGDEFTLAPGDVVTIEIDGIGTLENHVVQSTGPVA